jgi:hypothetical protein
MKKFKTAVVSGLLFFAFQNTANATQEIPDSEKIKQLESVITSLEERVSRLEKQPKSTHTASSHEGEKVDSKLRWTHRKSWLQLKVGMPTNQVEAILGHPIRVDSMGGGYKKLFYWGELPTGAISGYLEMYEGKIYKIYLPEFHE